MVSKDQDFDRSQPKPSTPTHPVAPSLGSQPDSTASSAKSGMADAGDRVKNKAEQAREGAEKHVRRMVSAARDQSLTMVENQKQAAAREVQGIAGALHKTAEYLNEQDQPSVAGYANQAADGLERFSRTLRDRDFGSLMRQTEDFARRQPGIFFGSAAVVGFFLARFLKSSAERREYDYDRDYDYGRGYDYDSQSETGSYPNRGFSGGAPGASVQPGKAYDPAVSAPQSGVAATDSTRANPGINLPPKGGL